ncbi:hypothetical protein PLANPX_3831 [Lacipirellula parvula]|uniref:Uncharacterized protein n=2 Tax=Lacipirellula parvula TaxID=2650471 RepID=A0A5K7XMF5_9BACT|nr:hypothetical protein PLANPX_3831 [Lacipirellula parvula]
MLEKPASSAEWRATWACAISADLDGLNREVADIGDQQRAYQLAVRIEQVMTMLAQVHQELAEENKLAAEANELESKRVGIAAAEAKRNAQQLVVAKQAAAARKDATKWLDLRVVRDGDEIVVWRDVREFSHVEGPNHVQQFRNYSVKVASYPSSEAPPEVLARIGMPVTRSKVNIPYWAQ